MSRRYNNNNSRQHQQEEWVVSGNNNSNDNNGGGGGGNSNRNFHKQQKKFVPRNPKPSPTLSNSLRQFDVAGASAHTAAAAATSSADHTGASSSSSRLRMGDNGRWLSSKAETGAWGHGGGGNFVNYLPQDEAVAAGLGAEEGGLDPVESQRVVDLLNRELSWLLKLGPRDFWREVASDTSLHEFLDSFLKFRSRWYDFPHRGAKGVVAGVVVGELELCRRVFMVLYRLSSNRDPGARAADSLSSKDHEVLLQEKKLLDLPKLLDICAIYGHQNEKLTGLLVSNALKGQPGIHANLGVALSHFLGIIHTMYQRCITSLEALFSSGSSEDQGSSSLSADFLEVMDFINDAVVSMDAFVSAYKPAAVFFSCPIEMSHGNAELLITLARLHDILLPSLRRGFRIILSGRDDDLILDIAVSLNMLSMRILKFGWKLLEVSYLSDDIFHDSLSLPALTKMFPATVEDPVIRTDILIQVFREANGVSLSAENQRKYTFLQGLDKNYHVVSRLQSLQNNGWIFMDDEQLQYLSGIMFSSVKSTVKEPIVVPIDVPSDNVQMDEDSAFLESKISQIKDLFPDYGRGFLAACLEVYNQNPEEVIQRILEGTLHEDLQCLDTSLETMPKPKPASTVNRNDKGKGKLEESASSVSRNDKGKGKLIESASTVSRNNKGKGKLVESAPPFSYASLQLTAPAATEKQKTEGSSVSSLSGVGRFVRKSDDMLDHYTLGTRDAKDSAVTAALISQYEYEDEYDDSFDDLGFSVAESGLEDDETLSDRISSGRDTGTEAESTAQTARNSKWGSRRQPQYYVKDGKNYSYKVEGSIAVANAKEASLVSGAQRELIHGLGRGGNIPLGAAKKLAEYEDQLNQPNEPEMEGRGRGRGRGRGSARNSWGRGKRGGAIMKEANEEQTNQSDGSDSESEGRENAGNSRGRGRGSRGRGRSNQYRKDLAMKKHFAGLSGF